MHLLEIKQKIEPIVINGVFWLATFHANTDKFNENKWKH